MRILLIIILSVLVSVPACRSQDEKVSLVEDDSLLISLEELLPVGWILSKEEGKLVISKNDSVWVLFENKINAPISFLSEEEEVERIKQNGERVKSKLVFKLEDKWTGKKIQEVKENNSIIYSQIRSLPEKFDIIHLYDSTLSRKGEDIFIASNEEEQKRIEEYELKKTELENKLIKLPDFHSEKYSLFLISKIGMEDEFHSVYPKESSEEMYRLENLIKEILR